MSGTSTTTFKSKIVDDYTIATHKHRLSAWAASRAASTSPVCRFRVEQGFAILEAADFTPAFVLRDINSPEAMDTMHKQWCDNIINAATKEGLNFTYGIAAKLVNCYLKTRFVCGGYTEDDTKHLHPPIDSLLLEALYKEDIGGRKKTWKKLANRRWSKFNDETYQEVIDTIRSVMNDKPLWKIEAYWSGFRNT